MKSTKAILLAMLLGLPTGSLLAQDQNDGPPPGAQDGQGGPGGRHHRPPLMPIIKALDTNHDGVLSAEEIANAPAALKTLDTNSDGQLTKDEYLPKRPDGQGPGPDGPPPGDANGGDSQGKHKRPLPPIIKALDTNGDGIISADEIANASASLLKLDKNGDGKLTMDEMMGPRPQMGGGRGGPDGGPEGNGGPPDDGGGPPMDGGPDGNGPPPNN